MGSAVSTLFSRYASCPLFHMIFSQKPLSAVQAASLPPVDSTSEIRPTGGIPGPTRAAHAPTAARWKPTCSRAPRARRSGQVRHGRCAAICHPQSRWHSGRNLPRFDSRSVRFSGFPARQLALFLQVFRQTKHVLLRHLREDFVGLAVDHPNYEPVGFRILLEKQLVLRSEHFRAVDRLDRLHHFSFFCCLVQRFHRRWRMYTGCATADCGYIHDDSFARFPFPDFPRPDWYSLFLSAGNRRSSVLNISTLCPKR